MSLADDLNAAQTVSRHESSRIRRERDQAEAENVRLKTRLDEVEKALQLVETATTSTLTPPKWLSTQPSKRAKRATLLLLLSDTHFDEVVQPDEVANLNAYNRQIAELRLKTWTENSIKVARHYLAGITYDGVVVMLGGDIFSGDIHDELAQTNEDTILGSLLHWSEQMVAALTCLADDFGKVHVAAVMGNHGRMSRKPRAKLRARTNFDWLLAKMIERHLSTDRRFTFQIGENTDCLVDIYGKGHLLTHGDQVNGGGGIGGIWPPIKRMQARKAQRAMEIGQPFQTLYMGHWHQLIQTPGLVINGSMKGTDEYAWINNFGHEPPQQALAVITPEHGVTIQAPIFCADRKAEKW